MNRAERNAPGFGVGAKLTHYSMPRGQGRNHGARRDGDVGRGVGGFGAAGVAGRLWLVAVLLLIAP